MKLGRPILESYSPWCKVSKSMKGLITMDLWTEANNTLTGPLNNSIRFTLFRHLKFGIKYYEVR